MSTSVNFVQEICNEIYSSQSVLGRWYGHDEKLKSLDNNFYSILLTKKGD